MFWVFVLGVLGAMCGVRVRDVLGVRVRVCRVRYALCVMCSVFVLGVRGVRC